MSTFIKPASTNPEVRDDADEAVARWGQDVASSTKERIKRENFDVIPLTSTTYCRVGAECFSANF
jgi:hypothetical protein